MHCPFCRHPDSRVVDSRTTDDGTSIRRRRQCPDCSRRFTTVETCSLMVVKRSGVTEPFSRTKVISGVRKACQGRPVTEDALAKLGQRVEEAVRATGERVEIEATGGLTLEVAAAYAATGVDYLSVGGLTHSSPILDIALDLDAGGT